MILKNINHIFKIRGKYSNYFSSINKNNFDLDAINKSNTL